MQLRAFTADLAATVASWVMSPAEAVMWCGHTDGLLPVEKIASWATGEGVHAFGLYADDRLVGYGELWIDDDEVEVELARLIVDPARRGQGIGRALVAELVSRAQERYPSIFMRVHPDNGAALRCYAAAGFERVSADLEAEWNAPQPVNYAWLT
jgi:ribosomal protein S18 acetylase RimI-like enzyme